MARTADHSTHAADGLAECLDENQALLLVTRAAGDEAETWRRHVDGCEACRAFVGGLARVMVPDTAETQGGWGDVDGVLSAGTRLGKYVVGGVLGRGGMGCVYAARDDDLDREVALKLLHLRSEEESGRAIARLRREAASMAALSHPNVASVFDYGQAPAGAYVAMERIDGEDLRRWLEAPQRSEAILDAFVQAGHGLAAAHAAGVVHRDFKPSNAMMGTDGRVRVLDFGLALDVGSVTRRGASEGSSFESPLGKTSPPSLTLPYGAGTPAYAAPEQLAGARPSAAADQFAFCVALCEALVGERPFHAPTAEDRARRIAAGELPAGLREQPKPIARTLAKGLRPRPQDRFASMEALLASLRGPTRSARAIGWGAAAVAVVGVALGVVLSRGATQPCDDGRERMASLWNDARIDRWRADPSTAVVVPRLDAEVEAWLDVRGTTCAQRSENAALFEHRSVCLERAAVRLGDTLARLERVRERGDALPSRPLAPLASVADCLEDTVPKPQASALAEEYELLDAKVLEFETEGRLPDAGVRDLRLEIEALRVRASEIGDLSLQGELTRKLGAFAILGYRFDEGERYLQEAYLLTTLAGDAGGQLDLCETMVALFTQYLLEPKRAAYWAARGSEAAEALGSDGARARAEILQGGVELAAGRFDAAVQHYDEAERLLGSATSDRLAELVILRGEAKARSGDMARAAEDFERSLQLTEARLGPDHPDLRSALNALATASIDLGEFQKGEALLRRAIAVTPPRAAMELAFLRGNLATLYADTGTLERALPMFVEVRAELERIVGPEHPETVRGTVNVADTLRKLGRDTEALRLYDSLLVGTSPAFRGQALHGRAAARVSMGDAAGARADYEALLELPSATPSQREIAAEALAALDAEPEL